MKINLIIDKNIETETEHLKRLLNNNANYIEFEIFINNIDIEDGFIVSPSTQSTLYKQLSDEEKEDFLNFVITDIPYINNYFFEGYENLVLLSLFKWKSLTNLPIENGILFFIIFYLARMLENTTHRHEDNTGCIYDFLGDKRGVDKAMRQASFCKDCLDELQKRKLSDEEQKILYELENFTSILSKSSKWNKSILEKDEEQQIDSPVKRKPKEDGIINIVIASPGDVVDEREYLLNKLERKFRLDGHEELTTYRLCVNGWEDLPSQNGYAQDVINRDLIQKADIVVAIFKHKLGTPTKDTKTGERRAPSGTAEELFQTLDNQIKNKPLGMTYFYSTPPSASFESEDFESMLDDWKKLKKFKLQIMDKVLYKPFTSREDLIAQVNTDIMLTIKSKFMVNGA
ncbi:hypothetical protein VS868_14230 [Salinimicrobium sp. 3283s]|uniref:hypothetical protein n=1 Tax=Salinimicrobium sp. 3283s TaxID=3114359 RepID=UPI0031E80739